MSTIIEENKLHDIIDNNVLKAHALTLVLQMAFENKSSLANEYLVNATWAIAGLLGDAEDAQHKLREMYLPKIKKGAIANA